MSDSTEKLQRELQAARRELAEARARCERHDTEHQAATKEIDENRSALLFMLEDLEAGRKKVEQAHHEWMAALDVVGDPTFLHDKEFRILRCNRAYQKRAGMPFNEIIGQPYYEVFPKTGGPLSSCLHALDKEEEEEEEVTVGETIYRSRAFSIHDEQDVYLYSVHILEDITESRRTSVALRESEKLYRSLFENMLNGFAYCRMIFEDDQPHDFIYLSVNAAFETLTGLKNVAGKRVSEVIPGIRQSDPGLFEIYGRVSLSGKPERLEIYLESLQQWFWISVYSPEKGYFVAVFDVITERKQAEAAIQHANRALATLSAVNKSLVRADSEDELLPSICQAIIKQRGYRMAWVGYVQHDEGKSIKVMARAGHDEGYLDSMQLTWAETERGMGSSGRAIRSGTAQLCQDMINDPSHLPWRDAASQRGYASDIALPLTRESGDVFGILHVYSGETNAFTPAEIDLLEEMAGDLAFGVRSLHTRHERDLALEQNQQQLVKLQDSLEDTVRAMASIVEMRDPYTAGHQLRVADLATALAKQMGLPEEQVHAIHLAGIVHDLGKIQIPAEILSKPGEITDLEFGLIKIHPQAGCDILKGIDFPWPIAQMVLQHHERLDGSGYPQGLKGEAILLEARILAVADVVEAISAHRPYRAGLGIEVALEEIAKNRGIYYDPQVVDACLTLFREQGYKFG